ncbi:MAG: V-type ATP synthase subunit E [Clostridium sp.]|nr:V-type ATP synthase subunit E [Clostridium sp.]
MAGLDKIIGQIEEESKAAAARTIEAARAEAEKILETARKEAEAECADIERRSAQAVANILERGKSAAELKKRGSLLAEKQKLIGDTIARAKEELKNMEAEAYFDMILKLAVKSAQSGEGEILFSAKDLARLPQGFEEKLNAALKGRGAALRISGDARDIDAGFVLTYGGIEENCSIDALFDSAHELLQDKAQEILFS